MSMCLNSKVYLDLSHNHCTEITECAYMNLCNILRILYYATLNMRKLKC